MGNEAPAVARSTPPTIVARLARFFRNAVPVRPPVSREVLFASALAGEFAATLRLQNSDAGLDAGASVLAAQHHNGRTAVAARVTRDVPNWIVKL